MTKKPQQKYLAMTDPHGNLIISHKDLVFIRSLPDFDLIMLLSDTHHHDWSIAMHTLELQQECDKKGQLRNEP